MSFFIREIPEDERPRERLIKRGPYSLTNAEILAIILSTGTKDESVIELSKRLMYQLEKLSQLNKITYEELIQIKGIKKAKACSILAAIELGKRLKENNNTSLKEIYINDSFDVFELLQENLKQLEQEHVIAIYIDIKAKLIKYETIYIGTLNQVVVHPREIFKNALKLNAYGVILVHNHPSGNSQPSSADRQVTDEMVAVGEILKIQFIDHVIIGNNEFYSIREKKRHML
ncbi:MAG: DNA repair protein RadC [Acholeplasmataceae bacterium]|nr:DNA repair protein RadC [Acholeplasmataceae bacterium]